MTIHVATAPVCWGIFEFAGMSAKYPYTQVLDEIAQTGYGGIELGPYGYLPTDPAILGDALEAHKLRLLSAFVPVALVNKEHHEAGLHTVLKVGKLLVALGAQHVVLSDDNGAVPALVKQAGQRTGSALDPAGWDVFASGVDYIAKRAYEELGLGLVFHHHCAGYVETPEETAALLERTDPQYVGLCLDTGHCHYGGGDAVSCLKRYGKRVRYLHFKDYQPEIGAQCRQGKADYFKAVEAGVFCPLGQGAVDFPGLLAALESLGYDGWTVVEQDILTDDVNAPKRYAQANRDYLKTLGI
jgi:inosose dehydratase